MASPPEALAQAHLEWDTPLYRMAVAQFDQAVPIAQISDAVARQAACRFAANALLSPVGPGAHEQTATEAAVTRVPS